MRPGSARARGASRTSSKSSNGTKGTPAAARSRARWARANTRSAVLATQRSEMPVPDVDHGLAQWRWRRSWRLQRRPQTPQVSPRSDQTISAPASLKTASWLTTSISPCPIPARTSRITDRKPDEKMMRRWPASAAHPTSAAEPGPQAGRAAHHVAHLLRGRAHRRELLLHGLLQRDLAGAQAGLDRAPEPAGAELLDDHVERVPLGDRAVEIAGDEQALHPSRLPGPSRRRGGIRSRG